MTAWILLGVTAVSGGVWWYLRTPKGAEAWDGLKLRLLSGRGVPRGGVEPIREDAGTLAKSGVSLLPA